MNEILNKFVLAGNKFMPERHLKQPGFTYSGCGPFTRDKERTENFMETGNRDFIYLEMNLIKLAFHMLWLMLNQKI